MRKGSKQGDRWSEVRELRDRALYVLEFFENAQGFRSDLQRQIIEAAAAEGDVRGLKEIAHELEEAMDTLAPQEREGLEAVLRSRFGIDKDRERSESHRWADSVLARGTIRSEKERRRLEEYVDKLEASDGDPERINALSEFLRSH